jgi:hypothetical protein
MRPNIAARLKKSSMSPQIIIERVPQIAQTSPHDTGASRLESHFSLALSYIFIARDGLVVVISTRILPTFAFSIIHCGPKYVSSTFFGSQIILIIISDLALSWAIVSIYVAPSSTRLSVFDLVLLYTKTGCPALIICWTIAFPMTPVPIHPIVFIYCLLKKYLLFPL